MKLTSVPAVRCTACGASFAVRAPITTSRPKRRSVSSARSAARASGDSSTADSFGAVRRVSCSVGAAVFSAGERTDSCAALIGVFSATRWSTFAIILGRSVTAACLGEEDVEAFSQKQIALGRFEENGSKKEAQVLEKFFL